MEIDVTDLFKEDEPHLYSASMFELGERAGKITWDNAIEASETFSFVTRETRPDIVAFVKSAGAWSLDEIAGWTDVELNALLIQWVAGDMREGETYALDDNGEWNWNAYYEAAQAGHVASRLYENNGRIYYDLSE